jgi:HlyD family secretion protein
MTRGRFAILLLILTAASAIFYLSTVDRSTDLVLIGAVDSNQVIVSSKIAGRLEKLMVEEGTQVKEGDLIAVLDSAELEAQKRAAEAMLASLRSQVAAARYSERVTKGSTRSDVANAQARLQSSRASLAEAEANLVQIRQDSARTVSLAEQGVASQQEKDRALASLNAQMARVQSLRDMVNAAEADLNAARARLRQTGYAENTVAALQAQMASTQAQLAEAETRLSYTKIYAPVAGTVSVRAAREGEVVNPATPIVTIVDLSDTWAYAALPETYADHIRLGDHLNVRLPGGGVLNGEVIFKAPESDFATQRDVSRRKRDIKTVALKVRIDNRQRALVPGMTAEVLVPKSVLDGKELPPANALGEKR